MNRCGYRSRKRVSWSHAKYPYTKDDGLKNEESLLSSLIESGSDEIVVITQMQKCFRIFGCLMHENRLPFEYRERFGPGGELYYDHLANKVAVEQREQREKMQDYHRAFCVLPRQRRVRMT